MIYTLWRWLDEPLISVAPRWVWLLAVLGAVLVGVLR